MKHLKSLSLKNFITTAIILLLSFVITGAAFSGLLYRYTYQTNLDNMSDALEQVSRVVLAYGTQWDLDDIEMRIALSSTSTLTGCDIIITDSDGTVVSCSDVEFNCRHIGCNVPLALIGAIPQSGVRSGVGSIAGVYSGQRQYMALRLAGGMDGKTSGYLIMSTDMRSSRMLWREHSKLFIFSAAFVFVVAAVITYAASRHQTEPINEIAAVSGRFGRGELDARVEDSGRLDEIGQLQRSFNAMADSLENIEKNRRELIANVSHDLKTPITTISGFSDGILDGTVPPEKMEDYLRTISSEAKRMNRMVQNMLAMSRMESLNTAEILRGSFDICEVMRISLLGFENRIDEKHLDVALTLPEEDIIVRGDGDGIMRVVTNLIDNSIKFADAGSTLTLEVWKQNGKAHVLVQNEGESIAPEELPKIFERFHKGDASRNLDKSGSGLGLYIVKKILDNHREDIFVSSENRVTRFIFTLSLYQ